MPIISIIHAVVFSSTLSFAAPFDEWYKNQAQRSWVQVLTNVQHPKAAPGAVIASPSTVEPDYLYHWVRDAGVTMELVARFRQNLNAGPNKDFLTKLLWDFAKFSRKNQLTQTRSGIGHFGEPKFHIDGSAYNGDWGRPQNDGPALRAIALLSFARQIMTENRSDLVKELLYDGRTPSQTVLKADLDWISAHWKEPGFDLWEEIRGQHFYTRMVQRRALFEGAVLASVLGDTQSSKKYWSVVTEISHQIQSHWDENAQLIRPTLSRDAGIDYKLSQLDIAVVLGSLHGATDDGFYAPGDARVEKSLRKLQSRFQVDYYINRQGPGVAFGRYPEDRYDGTRTDQVGHPWFLATLAVAEYEWRSVRMLLSNGKAHRRDSGFHNGTALNGPAKKKLHFAKSLLERVRLHADSSGNLTEQFDRQTGFMRGATQLTWSHVAFLQAFIESSDLLNSTSH